MLLSYSSIASHSVNWTNYYNYFSLFLCDSVKSIELQLLANPLKLFVCSIFKNVVSFTLNSNQNSTWHLIDSYLDNVQRAMDDKVYTSNENNKHSDKIDVQVLQSVWSTQPEHLREQREAKKKNDNIITIIVKYEGKFIFWILSGVRLVRVVLCWKRGGFVYA